MSTLPKVDYEREEFCRFDDYGRYAKHLSRKLHTCRKSVAKKQDVLLFSAERVWANAMQNKSLNGKTQITLNKLRKACKHAEALVESHGVSSAEERLQATVYHDYLLANLAQERGSYDVAILHHSRALVALQNQSSPLLGSVETGLRFSIYQSGAEERSINLQKFALEQITADESQSEWRALVDSVNPGSLKEEKSEEMITSIQWASRSAHLTNPDLATSISSAVSGRSSLTSTTTPNDFDAILASWSAASTTLDQLLEKEEDQNLAQDLELTKAWLQYHASRNRIARDTSLIKTVSAREGVLLSDAIIRTYSQVLALPGLSSAQESDLHAEQRRVRGERCVLLAETYGSSLEAIALVNRALTYFDKADPRRKSLVHLLNQKTARYTLLAKRPVRVIPTTWFTGDVKQIGSIDPSDLMKRSVTMKPVVFDIAWNYIAAQQQGVGQVREGHGSSEEENVDRNLEGNVVSTPQQQQQQPKKGIFGGLFGSR